MKYAAYPSPNDKTRIRILISKQEVEQFNLSNILSLSAAYGTNNMVIFRPDGPIKFTKQWYDKDSSPYYTFYGTANLKLPACGSRVVEPQPIDEVNPKGFRIPRLGGPIRSRMPVRKNGKDYGLKDLSAAIALVEEVAQALGVELTLIEGKFYLSI